MDNSIEILNIRQLNKLCQDINYDFNNKDLLRMALTRRSASIEKGLNKNTDCYERLEFLGDSLIGMIITEHIFYEYPTASEGFLTNERIKYCKNSFLSQISNKFNLSSYIIAGTIEINKDPSLQIKIQADLLEAIIGAAFIDSNKNYSIIKRLIMFMFFDKEDDNKIKVINDNNDDDYNQFSLFSDEINLLETNKSYQDYLFEQDKLKFLNNDFNRMLLNYIPQFNCSDINQALEYLKKIMQTNNESYQYVFKYNLKQRKYIKCEEILNSLNENVIVSDYINIQILYADMLYKRKDFLTCEAIIDEIIINNQVIKNLTMFQEIELNIKKIKVHLINNNVLNNSNFFEEVVTIDNKIRSIISIEQRKIFERKLKLILYRFYKIYDISQVNNILKEIISIDKEYLLYTKYFFKDLKLIYQNILDNYKN